jgi:uncharacterized membrane protein YtjA (UPF0391 family)
MLRIILVFALMTLVAAGVDFGWVTSDSDELGRIGFWVCGAITLALLLRAAIERLRG